MPPFKDETDPTPPLRTIAAAAILTTLCLAHPCAAANASTWTPTSSPLDLAIDGPGWFVLRHDFTTQTFITRRGRFRLDSYFRWVTEQGYVLQGENAQGESHAIHLYENRGLMTADSPAILTHFTWTPQGQLLLNWSDGIQSDGDQIILQNPSNPERLILWDQNIFLLEDIAGPLAVPAKPGQSGLGTIIASAVNSDPPSFRLRVLPGMGPTAEGALTPTGISTDLAIRGPHFFKVRHPQTGAVEYTRAGLFLVDQDGYWITYDRWRLQGIVPPDYAFEGDLQLSPKQAPATSDPEAVIVRHEIRHGSRLWALLNDGTSYVAGFLNPYRIIHPFEAAPNALGRYVIPHNKVAAAPDPMSVTMGSVETIHLTPALLESRKQFHFPSQSKLQATGVYTHAAISGMGWFQVINPHTKQPWVTRSGDFILDSEGYLTTPDGLQVIGYNDSNRTQIGPIRLPLSEPYTLSNNGILSQPGSQGDEKILGQILLQRFAEPFQLQEIRGTSYLDPIQASMSLGMFQPGTSGTGMVTPGAVESAMPPSASLTPESPLSPRIHVSGPIAESFSLEYSDDLKTWKLLATDTLIHDEKNFPDTFNPTGHQRFYRFKP